MQQLQSLHTCSKLCVLKTAGRLSFQVVVITELTAFTPELRGQAVCSAGQTDNASTSKFQIDLHLLSCIKNSGPSVRCEGVIRDNGEAYLSERTDKTY